MEDDWAARSPRWSGIRSERVGVFGTEVHLLRADAGPGAPDGAPAQLLVHGLGGSATNWLEVMGALSAFGPVVAPDLPGFGRTRPPSRGAARTGANTRFLRALLDALGIDRAVVHGNSMGGLLSVRLAAQEPDRIERLVLVSPALPAPLRTLRAVSPATLLRFAPFVVPRLGKRILGWSWQRREPAELYEETARYLHADPSRVSAAIAELGVERIAWGREQPWRLDGFATAANSVVGAMTVGQRALAGAIGRVDAPTLVVWGAADRLVGRHVIDHLAERRPDWDAHVFEGVGHVPQVEVPDAYVEVVDRWMSGRTRGDPRLAGDAAT